MKREVDKLSFKQLLSHTFKLVFIIFFYENMLH